MSSPPRPPARRRAVQALIWTVTLLVAGGVVVAGVQQASATHQGDPSIVAAGDISCATTHTYYNGGEGTATQCRQKHTSDLALSLHPDNVFMLGDGQYSVGSLTQYNAAYDPTWGRMKSVTRPAPGDHEYQSGSANGYFQYFGVQPYYSFDIGSWHWISLNSELAYVPLAEQLQWLERDLATTDKPCIGAFWGTPAFSSSGKGNNTAYRPFWDALYAAHADVVMSGDHHHYERFAQQAPDGTAASDGIRQFVVGTGGRSLEPFSSTIQPNSEVRAKVFGVLEMRLGAGDYGWQFHTESGGTFSDSGQTACNAKGGVTSTTTPTETTTTPTETTTTPTETTTTPTETTATVTTETTTTTTTTTSTATTTATSSVKCYGLAATIVGTKASDTLTGTAGDDVIAALGGNDIIDGGEGNDVICGAGGADQITGGPGNDRINAGPGGDTVTDLVGADAIDGSSGSDTLNVRDSAVGDTVNGGTDADTCRVDSGDKVRNCESQPTT